MSELRSVLAFFIGLVIFVVLIGLAIGRIRLPARQTANAQPTPTVVATPSPTPGPGFLDRLRGIFRRPTATPTMSPPLTVTPTPRMRRAVEPTFIVDEDRIPTPSTKGGIPGAVTIPDTGASTLLTPLAFLLGGAGFFLRKRK